MAYPSSIIASTLAKPSFVQYLGVGDAEGTYPNKKRLVGAITALFQVSRSLPVVINLGRSKGRREREDANSY
jgi:hypothetical protein